MSARLCWVLRFVTVAGVCPTALLGDLLSNLAPMRPLAPWLLLLPVSDAYVLGQALDSNGVARPE
jgi:hypothetical protein